jgi:hypothetical protein
MLLHRLIKLEPQLFVGMRSEILTVAEEKMQQGRMQRLSSTTAGFALEPNIYYFIYNNASFTRRGKNQWIVDRHDDDNDDKVDNNAIITSTGSKSYCVLPSRFRINTSAS